MATGKGDDQLIQYDNLLELGTSLQVKIGTKMKLGPKVDIGNECVVTMHDADTNDNMFTIVHDCVVTLHDAYTNDHFHRLPHCLSVSAHCLVLSCLHIVTRTRTVAQVMSLSHHPHVHVHVSVSPRLALPFYITHSLPHSFHFLLHLKFVDYNLLRTPHKEGMDLSDEFLLSTGYEPNAYDFEETSVEPYTELLDSPPLFSDKVSSADADYDDAALEGMLREAHRVHSHHSPREDLSVSLSSSVSDRTERPVGDRTGRPVEQRNQEAQIRTLLDKQKILQSAKQ